MLANRLLSFHIVRRCLATRPKASGGSRRPRAPVREQTQKERDAGYKAGPYSKINAAFSGLNYAGGQKPSASQSVPQHQPDASREKKNMERDNPGKGSEFDADAQMRDEHEDKPSRFSQQEPAQRRAVKKKDTYHYLEENDRTFKESIIGLRNRKQRMKNRNILLEGARLIMDAIECGVPISKVFASKKELMDAIVTDKLDAMNPELYMVQAKQMRMWSELVTPPGIMAIAQMPELSASLMRGTMPLTVILDNIRDPGNMGAIVRVLAAAGCSQLITIEDCVDPWDGKVLRAGMGGHFRMPIHYNLTWDDAINYIDEEASVFIADNLEEKGIDPFAPVIDERRAANIDRKRSRNPIETISYHEADFRGKHVALIIGGETHGVSHEAYRMTSAREGLRVSIPMSFGMESLNAASAVAVFAFEMKRQRIGLVEEADDDNDVEVVFKTENEEAKQMDRFKSYV